MAAVNRIREWCLNRKTSSRERTTPLPKIKVILIGSILLINQFGAALIFPFLPFMVHDFFPELNKDELGQKAGFLGSAFFIGNFGGSLMWGWLSDVWGRRPVMLLGICGTIFSEILFGLSQNFAWAIVARFLWGFLNGNIGVAKTYLSEICDDTNQAQGFSVVGTASGIGRLLGSIVGGYLAQPGSKYHIFEHPFFCQFPYVLPIFVAVGIGMFSFTTGLCFLNETLPKARQVMTSNKTVGRGVRGDGSDNSGSDISSEEEEETELEGCTDNIELVSYTRSDPERESVQTNGTINDIYVNTVRESDLDTDTDVNNTDTELLLDDDPPLYGIRNNRKKNWLHLMKDKIKRTIMSLSLVSLWKKFLTHHKEQCIACCYCCYSIPSSGSSSSSSSILSSVTTLNTWKRIGHKIASNTKMMLKLMLDRRVILSTSTYGLLGFVAIMTNELFPLLMVTNHEHGGYKMDDNEIATFIMIVAFIQLVFQPIVFPRLVKIFGYRKLLRIAMLIFVFGCLLLPWSNTITGPIQEEEVMAGESGSGNESGSGVSLNETITDYCGRSADESSINENSVKRIPAKVWAILLLSLLSMILARVTMFTSIMVMVNNSALPETRGSVNGIGQSLVSIGRSISPTSGSILLAWSEGNGLHWPWNYHLAFELCSIVMLGVFLLTFLFPKTIEKKRERETPT